LHAADKLSKQRVGGIAARPVFLDVDLRDRANRPGFGLAVTIRGRSGSAGRSSPRWTTGPFRRFFSGPGVTIADGMAGCLFALWVAAGASEHCC
jgi:hypothetical protein